MFSKQLPDHVFQCFVLVYTNYQQKNIKLLKQNWIKVKCGGTKHIYRNNDYNEIIPQHFVSPKPSSSPFY